MMMKTYVYMVCAHRRRRRLEEGLVCVFQVVVLLHNHKSYISLERVHALNLLALLQE